MLVETAVTEFLLSLEPGRGANTMMTYRASLLPFRDWCKANGVETIAQLDRSVVRRFMAESSRQYAQYTLRNMTQIFKRFLRWLAAEEGVADLSQYVATSPIRPSIQRTLSRAEVTELLESCDDSPAGLRNASIISLLLDTGMRASELVRINIGDLDLRQQQLQIRIKGGREYKVRFGDHSARLLRDWMRELPNTGPKAPLFVSLGGNTSGQRLTRQGLRLVLGKMGTDTGIPNVTVHAFRRTFATELLRQGVPTRIVQILGRWQDVSMVELYSRQLEQESINISLSDIFASEKD